MQLCRTMNVCVQHFDLYKLPKSKLTNANILCLVRFGSGRNKLVQLLIRSRNSGSRTIRSLIRILQPEKVYFTFPVQNTPQLHILSHNKFCEHRILRNNQQTTLECCINITKFNKHRQKSTHHRRRGLCVEVERLPVLFLSLIISFS